MRGPIERVARILSAADGHAEGEQIEARPVWETYVPTALEVVRALREPTGSMLAAEGYSRDAERIWKSMIDVAIAKGE